MIEIILSFNDMIRNATVTKCLIFENYPQKIVLEEKMKFMWLKSIL